MKPSILLLPGLLCDAALWMHQVEVLSGQYECVVADMTQDDSIGGMASRAIAEMPNQFAVAGLSMGGYCALEVMRQVPERVTKLSLLDTSARADTPDRIDIRRNLIERVRGGDFEKVISEHFQHFVHPSRLDDNDIMSRIRASALNVGPDAYMRQQTAIMQRPNSLEFLSEIDCPTLVLCGAEDALTPPPLHDEIAARISGAVLEKIPDSGHLPTLEQPELVTKALTAWMERT